MVTLQTCFVNLLLCSVPVVEGSAVLVCHLSNQILKNLMMESRQADNEKLITRSGICFNHCFPPELMLFVGTLTKTLGISRG